MKQLRLYPLAFLLIFSLAGTACKSSKNVPSNRRSSTHSPSKPHSHANARPVRKALETAQTYMGVPYKYGGTSRRGMDCSGLVMLSYKSAGINLPHASYMQAKLGKPVSTKKVQPGDLVFFTYRRDKRVSHVGIVSKVNNPGSDVRFIHASTKLGVCESNLYSAHYQSVFVQARRIVD